MSAFVWYVVGKFGAAPGLLHCATALPLGTQSAFQASQPRMPLMASGPQMLAAREARLQ